MSSKRFSVFLLEITNLILKWAEMLMWFYDSLFWHGVPLISGLCQVCLSLLQYMDPRQLMHTQDEVWRVMCRLKPLLRVSNHKCSCGWSWSSFPLDYLSELVNLNEYSLIPEILYYKLPMTKKGWLVSVPRARPLYVYVFRSISRLAIGEMKSRSPKFL